MTPPEAETLDVRALDVVVLAGGHGRRLGGVSKADVRLGRERLLDHILGDLARWDDPRITLGRVVVVAPASVSVPAGVLRTLEDPPGGGPCAGIASAVATLGTGHLVAVLACDAPRAARALPLLLTSLGPDGVVARNRDGFRDYLVGVYRYSSLAGRIGEQGDIRGMSARRLFESLALAAIDIGEMDRDVDTWEDLAALEGSG